MHQPDFMECMLYNFGTKSETTYTPGLLMYSDANVAAFMYCKLLFTTFLLLIWTSYAQGQRPEGWDDQDEIMYLRTRLREQITQQNTKKGAVLLDSLRDLSTPEHSALLWDERWLAYHWTERHVLLLEEIERYSLDERIKEETAKAMPKDSLFEALDQEMYARSRDYPAILQELGFNPEQKTFLNLHLQYLLRNNDAAEQDARRAFLNQYPQSKYNAFIRNFMQLPPVRRQYWFSLEAALLQNNFTGDAQFNIGTGWGTHFALIYHQKRWNMGAHYASSSQKNLRDLYGGDEVFPKGKRSNLRYYGVSVGYGVFDRPSMRVGPFVNLGLAHFVAKPPEETDGDDPPFNPYTDYDYFGVQAGGGITVDLKIRKCDASRRSKRPLTYSGLKMRAGYNFASLGQKNPQLKGNIVFVSLGWQLSDTSDY